MCMLLLFFSAVLAAEPDRAPTAAPAAANQPPVPVEAPDPPDVVAAIRNYDAGRVVQASTAFAQLLDAGTYPEKMSKLHYYLARALFDLGLKASADRHLARVTTNGPADPWFPWALIKRIDIARETGDWTDISAIALGLPPEQLPRSSRNTLYYLRGVQLFQAGNLPEARKYVAQVSDKADVYLPSLYVEGLIYSLEGKQKSAVKTFSDLARAPVSAMAEERRRDEDLRCLSLLDIARIYYSIERWEDARDYYGYVASGQSCWQQSVYEGAWTAFMAGDEPTLAAQLTVLEQPASPGDELPEAAVLRALQLLRSHRDADVPAVLASFDTTWRPAHAELRAVLGAPDRDALATYGRYLGEKPASTALPPSLLAEVHRDSELSGFLRHITIVQAEAYAIAAQSEPWRHALARPLSAALDDERARLEAAAGQRLLVLFERQATRLGGMLEQVEGVHIELADAATAPPDVRGAIVARLRERLADTSGGERVEVAMLLADCLRRQGAPAAAIDVYGQLLRETPPAEAAAAATWELALTFAEANEPEKANATLVRLTEQFPASPLNPGADVYIGEYWFARGDFGAARAAYQRALDWAPPPAPPPSASGGGGGAGGFRPDSLLPFAAYKLAWCRYALGDHAGAVAAMREVLPRLSGDLEVRARAELAKMEAAEGGTPRPGR